MFVVLSFVVPCVVAREVTYLLPQAGVGELLARALRAADPADDAYGALLTHDEVLALQRPAPAHAALLAGHLAEAGATNVTWSKAQDKVTCNVPAAYAAPQSVLAAVDGILGLEDWAASDAPRRGVRGAAPGAQGCLAEQVTPECLRKAYGLDQERSSHPANLQAVVVNQGFKPSDLAAFQQEHGLPLQPVSKLVGKLDGDAGDEATLDVEYILTTGAGTPTWWVSIDGEAANPFASWLTYMSDAKTVPLVQSLSVGAPEGEVGEKLAARMNAEFAALGARGVSILFASGDSGYVPQQKFGAASPFVTAVGGVFNGDLGDEPLQVDYMSTGGFSSLAANAAPAWQKQAVQKYLGTTGARPAHLDPTKRCVPDLSAYDAGFSIVQDGSEQPIGGTSAAAPVVAGMLSLINDALLHAGHSPLGFANPFLYANEAAFLDVVRGSNGGGNAGGFAAVPGYDPASGLGTFSPTTFAALKAAALKAKDRAQLRRARAGQVLV